MIIIMIIVIEFNGMTFWAIKPKSQQKNTHQKSNSGAGVAVSLWPSTVQQLNRARKAIYNYLFQAW